MRKNSNEFASYIRFTIEILFAFIVLGIITGFLGVYLIAVAVHALTTVLVDRFREQVDFLFCFVSEAKFNYLVKGFTVLHSEDSWSIVKHSF